MNNSNSNSNNNNNNNNTNKQHAIALTSADNDDDTMSNDKPGGNLSPGGGATARIADRGVGAAIPFLPFTNQYQWSPYL
jgi:hypothetical protein